MWLEIGVVVQKPMFICLPKFLPKKNSIANRGLSMSHYVSIFLVTRVPPFIKGPELSLLT